MGYTFNPLSGKFDYYNSSSASVTYDTKENILSSTPTQNKLAFATDTYKLYLGDGTSWREVELPLDVRSANPDMGAEQESGLNGFHPDYITDKLIANCTIGGHGGDSSGNYSEGDVRVNDGVFQIYLSSTWNDIVTGFTFREDSDEKYELEHDPVGNGNYYEVATGNSNAIGSNGYPLIMQYNTDIGASGVSLLVGGYEIN